MPAAALSPRKAAAALSPQALARALESFLTDNPRAVVVEDGAILFDMAKSRFTLDPASGRCVLQLWSEERNLVRTVTALEERRDALRLEVRRFGQVKPQVLRLVADRDQRSPSARETTRARYTGLLQRMMTRHFTDWKQGDLFASPDLEHSFGPAYARGWLERGQAAWAVVAINGEETPASIDGIVTVAVLWLAQLRERSAGRRLIEGVKVIVPVNLGATTAARMAWLNPSVAKWELYELDELHEELTPAALSVDGNLDVHLSAAFRPEAALARCRKGIDRLLDLLADEARARVELEARTPFYVSLRLHGLEFARVQHGLAADSFARQDRVSFGAGANETPLDADSEPLFRELAGRLFESRHPAGAVRNPLFRLQPERWLESLLLRELAELEPQLVPAPIYSQVPALAASDRGLLDLLAVTRGGRLAVIEIKTSEDLHLPFQGLDYWMRVRALHASGEFARNGYFTSVELSPAPPILYFVVPALRLHSEFENLLRHVSPEVEWRLMALDESWRKRLRVIFRKQGGDGKAMAR